MAHSCKWVTICTELFTIASLDRPVPNSHLPSRQPEGLAASYRGGQVEVHHKVWLSIQMVHGIWMYCLKAEVGGTGTAAVPPAEDPNYVT